MSVASQSIKSNFWLESLKNGDEEIVRFTASEEEYWDLVQLPEFRLDYNNGEIIASMSYATENHETITANLIRLLGNAFENDNVRVLGSNRPVRVQSLKKNFEPDIQVVFGDTELYYYKKTMNATLNPAILVEVLSDTTQKYDRTEKFDAYKLIDSLQYILFIESNKMNTVLYARTKKPNEWLMTTFVDVNDKMRIAGHSFPLKKIYQRVILNI
jgi:Uma2 family endonuclease